MNINQENIKKKTLEIYTKIKEFFKNSNTKFISVLDKNGKTFFRIPLMVGVFAVLLTIFLGRALGSVLVNISVLVALLCGYSIMVETNENIINIKINSKKE